MNDDQLNRLRMAVSNPRDFWSYVHGDAWAQLGEALEELADMRQDDPRELANEIRANLYEEGALSDIIGDLRKLSAKKTKAELLEAIKDLAEELADFDREKYNEGEYVRDLLRDC